MVNRRRMMLRDAITVVTCVAIGVILDRADVDGGFWYSLGAAAVAVTVLRLEAQQKLTQLLRVRRHS